MKREEMTGADRPAEGLFELISFYCYESIKNVYEYSLIGSIRIA